MTHEQMAIATRSSKIWLDNSRRIIGRRVHRTPSGARWWGLVRVLSTELGVPLKSAAQVADTILTPALSLERVKLAVSTDGSVTIEVDLERFHSTSNASLAAALAFAQPGKRGRPPSRRGASASPGRASTAVRIRVDNSLEKLGRLAAELRGLGARPRGIEIALPFIMDAATLRAVPRLALTTRAGELDVIVAVPRSHRESALSGPPEGR